MTRSKSRPRKNPKTRTKSTVDTTADPPVDAEVVAKVNAMVAEAFALLPWQHPVGAVRWVHIDRVHANDYNPNAVAHHEMRLLHVSIAEDGYTQPVVVVENTDTDPSTFEIVDGFHRYTMMRTHRDIYDTTGGYLPVVVIDKPIADRMAATVRHNRARGKHSVAGMSSLVFEMLRAGVSDTEICRKVGLEAEELARLKYITGYAKLYADHTYTRPVLTHRQITAKADYQRDHPEEDVPTDF